MSEQQPSNNSFVNAFLPGLILGLIVGALAGAYLPDMMGGPTLNVDPDNISHSEPGRDLRDGETPVDENIEELVDEAQGHAEDLADEVEDAAEDLAEDAQNAIQGDD